MCMEGARCGDMHSQQACDDHSDSENRHDCQWEDDHCYSLEGMDCDQIMDQTHCDEHVYFDGEHADCHWENNMCMEGADCESMMSRAECNDHADEFDRHDCQFDDGVCQSI